MKKTFAVINEGAGSVSADDNKEEEKKIEELFNECGLDADVKLLKGDRIQDNVKDELNNGYDIISAGGGDGTISGVSSLLVNKSILLGVIPAGTLNHFAKDLNIPLEQEDAIKNIAEGRSVKVDTAEVNGRCFINNSSIGFYPKAVKERERQKFPKIAKWFSTLVASLKIFMKFPLMRVKLVIEGKEIFVVTPLVFIGNNEYEMELFTMGERKSLQNGDLCLYYLKCKTRLSLLKVLLEALFGRLRQAEDFEYYKATELTLESAEPELHVAVDGEVIKLKPPLKYKIHPRSLNVIVPDKEK